MILYWVYSLRTDFVVVELTGRFNRQEEFYILRAREIFNNIPNDRDYSRGFADTYIKYTLGAKDVFTAAKVIKYVFGDI